MPNLVEINNLLSLVTEIILAIAALAGIFKFRRVWQKGASILILLIVCLSFVLKFYLQPEPNTVSANLHLSVYKPTVVNMNGTFSDEYLENVNYRVLCSTPYPLDTTFGVVITNMKTYEKNEYIISDVYGGGNIGIVDSGRYKLELYVNSELRQIDEICLSTMNLDGTGAWSYSIYVFDDFYTQAVKKTICLGESEYKLVQIPSFSIHSDSVYMYPIFKTDFIDNAGTFEGDFYFLPGRYYLNNAVTPTNMNEIVIDIE